MRPKKPKVDVPTAMEGVEDDGEYEEASSDDDDDQCSVLTGHDPGSHEY